MKVQLLACITIFTVCLSGEGAFAQVPAEKILASCPDGSEQTAVAWYYRNEAPLRKRDLAQTFRVEKGGNLAKILLSGPEKNFSDFYADGSIFTLRLYDNGQDKPMRRPTQGSKMLTQEGSVKLEGDFFVIALESPVPLTEGSYYTFIVEWKEAAPQNQISFWQRQGTAEMHRWHRDNRGSWSASPQSLVFYAVESGD